MFGLSQIFLLRKERKMRTKELAQRNIPRNLSEKQQEKFFEKMGKTHQPKHRNSAKNKSFQVI
jgi:hypothetical protein